MILVCLLLARCSVSAPATCSGHIATAQLVNSFFDIIVLFFFIVVVVLFIVVIVIIIIVVVVIILFVLWFLIIIVSWLGWRTCISLYLLIVVVDIVNPIGFIFNAVVVLFVWLLIIEPSIDTSNSIARTTNEFSSRIAITHSMVYNSIILDIALVQHSSLVAS